MTMLEKYLAEREEYLLAMTADERRAVADRMREHAATTRTRYALGTTPDELRAAATWIENLTGPGSRA